MSLSPFLVEYKNYPEIAWVNIVDAQGRELEIFDMDDLEKLIRDLKDVRLKVVFPSKEDKA